MEENKNIAKVIYLAIDIIKKRFGGIDVKLISDKMYRISPDEYTPLGKLGVDIEIEGIKTFLGCESMAQEIVHTPYGSMVADEFIFNIIKPNLKNMKSEFKKNANIVERRIKKSKIK